MMRIKEIKRKGKTQYTLTLEKNGDDFSKDFHQDTLIKHNLLNAREIPEKTYREALADDKFYTALEQAFSLLSRRTLSKENCRKSLLATTAPAVAAQVVDHLEKEGYLDDQKALAYIVEDAIEYDLKGPRLLREKLLKEGYEKEDVDRGLLRYDEEKEREKIRELLEKNLSQHLDRHPLRKIEEKLRTLLYRKGFNTDAFEGELMRFLEPYRENRDEETMLKERIEKLRGRYSTKSSKEKQRFIGKLMREGFSYDSIKKLLD